MKDTQTLIEEIRKELDSIKTFINADGGDVNFVSFKDGILTLEISGHCIGCMSFDVTYTYGIKENFKQVHPEIKDVIFTLKKSV
ncbi:MAG: NifU family protein [Mycoplasmoidaceae bacterium]|nr:NifU family protein [Mycoplasmoidaceae bacterium]